MCAEAEQVSQQLLARFVCFRKAFELQKLDYPDSEVKGCLAPVSDLIVSSLADSSGFLLLLAIFTARLCGE